MSSRRQRNIPLGGLIDRFHCIRGLTVTGLARPDWVDHWLLIPFQWPTAMTTWTYQYTNLRHPRRRLWARNLLLLHLNVSVVTGFDVNIFMRLCKPSYKIPCAFIFENGQPGYDFKLSRSQIRLDLTCRQLSIECDVTVRLVTDTCKRDDISAMG